MNHGFARLVVTGFVACGVSAAYAQDAQSAKSTARAPEASAMTASEKLAACEKKYAEAKTYSDEGVVTTEFTVPQNGQEIKDKKPFRTAFERTGRLYWEFRSSAMPGKKADQTYAVWSDDQKSFESYWTLSKEKASFGNIQMAFAGPTGVSGGAALAVIPLLRPDQMGFHGLTKLRDAVDKGTEVVDGHECTKIEGALLMGATTIWIDKDSAIRKVHQVMEIDPDKVPGAKQSTGKFTTKTTMTFKPKFDEKITDDKFTPPKTEK